MQEKIIITGIGLHSGQNTRLIISAGNDGIEFISSKGQVVNARDLMVLDTRMCTVAGNNKFSISTIEHLMAALYILNITNIKIEIEGPEIPMMDGSARNFIDIIQNRLTNFPSNNRIFYRGETKKIKDGENAFIIIEPAPQLIIDYTIDFTHPKIGRQNLQWRESDNELLFQIANSRSFGFALELEALHAKGLALGASLDNVIGLSETDILNPEGLRYEKEFVQHKILDCIGDLYMRGCKIAAKITAYKASHKLHLLALEHILREEKIANQIFA